MPRRRAEDHEDSLDYRQELMNMMERETRKDELAKREILGLRELEREHLLRSGQSQQRR
jgi:hypothetical protein